MIVRLSEPDRGMPAAGLSPIPCPLGGPRGIEAEAAPHAVPPHMIREALQAKEAKEAKEAMT